MKNIHLNGILIEYEIIKLSKLKDILPKVTENNDIIAGIILIIPDKILKKIELISPGKKRLNYINNKEFINNIVDYSLIQYNPNKK